MSSALTRLQASMTANSSAVASALALISTLSEQIRANVGDDDALNALADQLDAENHDIAAALVAGTPAAASTSDTTPGGVPATNSDGSVTTGQAPTDSAGALPIGTDPASANSDTTAPAATPLPEGDALPS